MTLDHRYGDAALIVPMVPIITDYFEDPENFDMSVYDKYLPKSKKVDEKKL